MASNKIQANHGKNDRSRYSTNIDSPMCLKTYISPQLLYFGLIHLGSRAIIVVKRYCISLIPLTKLTSFKLALNSPHRNLRLHSANGKQIRWVPRADARDGFPRLQQEFGQEMN